MTEKLIAQFSSKKFQALIGSVLTILSQDTAPGLFNLTPDSVKLLVGAIMVYMGAQGIADMGKEKAKVEKDLAPKPQPPSV